MVEMEPMRGGDARRQCFASAQSAFTTMTQTRNECDKKHQGMTGDVLTEQPWKSSSVGIPQGTKVDPIEITKHLKAVPKPPQVRLHTTFSNEKWKDFVNSVKFKSIANCGGEPVTRKCSDEDYFLAAGHDGQSKQRSSTMDSTRSIDALPTRKRRASWTTPCTPLSIPFLGSRDTSSNLYVAEDDLPLAPLTGVSLLHDTGGDAWGSLVDMSSGTLTSAEMLPRIGWGCATAPRPKWTTQRLPETAGRMAENGGHHHCEPFVPRMTDGPFIGPTPSHVILGHETSAPLTVNAGEGCNPSDIEERRDQQSKMQPQENSELRFGSHSAPPILGVSSKKRLPMKKARAA